jgi:hypothetical protein
MKRGNMSEAERPKPEQDAKTGRFVPGNGGNGGRPKGSKNRYAEAFWADLQAEWEIGGRAVIERVMAEEPAKFLAIAASVLPKDVSVKHEATDAFVWLWQLISDGKGSEALEILRSQEREQLAQSEPDDLEEPVRH